MSSLLIGTESEDLYNSKTYLIYLEEQKNNPVFPEISTIYSKEYEPKLIDNDTQARYYILKYQQHGESTCFIDYEIIFPKETKIYKYALVFNGNRIFGSRLVHCSEIVNKDNLFNVIKLRIPELYSTYIATYISNCYMEVYGINIDKRSKLYINVGKYERKLGKLKYRQGVYEFKENHDIILNIDKPLKFIGGRFFGYIPSYYSGEHASSYSPDVYSYN